LIIHVVRRGDNIYRLSRNYGVPASRIIEANRLTNPDSLVVGQALVIPGDISETTVRSGQSLYTIARNYGIGLDAILRANPGITSPGSLQIGQRVVIPAAAPKLGAILVNGYAFPSISRNVLADTLPHLTYLSPFSYQVRPDGSLKVIADTDLIQAARDANVAPMMVITNLEEGAGFSSELANTILTNEQLQNTLIGNIVSTLQEKNYFGLDVDFEYIYPEDRENYNQFMRRVVNVLRPLGYMVTVALAPKSSAGQSGLLYEAHDYAAMGAIVDHVILMTYEWGYTYGPAMAVSPINQVRRVLDYATSVIPSEKILMGMPNYGYDWTLPFVRGSAARSLSNTAALTLAENIGAVIQYDTVSQAPYFNYYDNQGRRHEVWFDDARSISARLRLVNEYNLGGVSYWTINSFHAVNWAVLTSMYDVSKVL